MRNWYISPEKCNARQYAYTNCDERRVGEEMTNGIK